MAERPARGLADVIAASTALSDIDGRAGRLSYRGYDINELAGHAGFEEIAYLLQRGSAPGHGRAGGLPGGTGRRAAARRPGRGQPGTDRAPPAADGGAAQPRCRWPAPMTRTPRPTRARRTCARRPG